MKKGKVCDSVIAVSVVLLCFPGTGYTQCDPSFVHAVDRMDDLSVWNPVQNMCVPATLEYGTSCQDSPSIKLLYEIPAELPVESWYAVMASKGTYDMSHGDDLVAVLWTGDARQYVQDALGRTAYKVELSFRDPTIDPVNLHHWNISRSHLPACRWFLIDKRLYPKAVWADTGVHIGVNSVQAGFADPGTISVDTVGTIDSLEAREQYLPSCLGRTSCRAEFAEIRDAAAEWIGSQQCASGFLKSWFKQCVPRGYTYSQAMGLRVLARTDFDRATSLVEALCNEDPFPDSDNIRNGLWWECRNCDTGTVIDDETLIGANGTLIRAIAEYLKFWPDSAPSCMVERVRRAADTLLEHQDAASGCIIDFEDTRNNISTEGNWNAYMGLAELADVPALCPADRERYRKEADEVLACLTRAYSGPDGRAGCWDAQQRRWYAGLNSTAESPGVYDQPDYATYLDANTLGALVAARSGDAALREMGKSALAFVRLVLGTSDCDWPGCDMANPILGLDSGGPYLPWNEGTLQYLVAAGCDSKSEVFLDGILRQIAPGDDPDLGGSLPGSVADFRAGAVWLTTWHGVDPTAWLYFALRSSYSDFDSDCDVDLIDYASFHDCLAGPGTLPHPAPQSWIPRCLDTFDGDSDADIDLQDFAGFQRAFTVPRDAKRVPVESHAGGRRGSLETIDATAHAGIIR